MHTLTTTGRYHGWWGSGGGGGNVATMRSGQIFAALFALAAFQGRFMSVFLKDRGLSNSEVGGVLCVSALVSLFAAPVWTLKADTMQRKDSKEVLLMASVVGAGLFFAAQAAVDLGLVPDALRFEYLLGCRFLASVSFSTWHPLANAIAVQDLMNQHAEQGSRMFARERLWGAVSWAVAHLFVGFAIDRFGSWTIYCGHAACSVCMVVVLERWRRTKHGYAQEERLFLEKGQHPQGTVWCGTVDKSVARIVTASSLHAAFFGLMLCTAAGMSLVENLLFIFFEEYLGASPIVCGVSVVVTVLFEIPLFQFGPDLLKKYGVPALLVVATLAYVVRVVLYTIVPKGWFVLLVEPLHGVTIALITIGANEFITVVAPPHRRTSAQGLLASVRTGAGYFIGTLSGGIIMDTYGEAALYRIYATIVMASLAVYVWAASRTRAENPDIWSPLKRTNSFPGPVVVRTPVSTKLKPATPNYGTYSLESETTLP